MSALGFRTMDETPEQARQAGTAMALLLFYSFLMFTLPFAAFFGTKYVLDDLGVTGYTNTVWSVLAAVITVNLIIIAYAYQAYHENEIQDPSPDHFKDD